MRIESTAFTAADLEGFLDELVEADKRSLVDRLERASARLAELGEQVAVGVPAGGEGWSAHEVLAHIAVLSKFYGVLTHRIGTGALTELDLLGNVNLRDVLGEQMAKLPPGELVASALADHRRTLEYLRRAPAGDLRRTARLSHGGEMSAADVARLALCAHLETHLRQLEASLA